MKQTTMFFGAGLLVGLGLIANQNDGVAHGRTARAADTGVQTEKQVSASTVESQAMPETKPEVTTTRQPVIATEPPVERPYRYQRKAAKTPFAALESACQRGNGDSCYDLATRYFHGKGVGKNLSRAAEFSIKGCRSGTMESCTATAIFYWTGQGVSKNAKTAATYFKKACAGRQAQACFNLGKMFERGEGTDEHNSVPADLSRASKYFKRACTLGRPAGCYEQGLLYEHTFRRHKKAARYYAKGCQGGVAKSCFNLGYLNQAGKRLKKNQKKANALYKKACDGGDMYGCTNLGLSYISGDGVSKDIGAGVNLLFQACMGGDDLGCRRALSIVKPSCDRDHLGACMYLAHMHKEGRGVPKDYTKAALLMGKACQGGIKKACDLKIPFAVKQSSQSEQGRCHSDTQCHGGQRCWNVPGKSYGKCGNL